MSKKFHHIYINEDDDVDEVKFELIKTHIDIVLGSNLWRDIKGEYCKSVFDYILSQVNLSHGHEWQIWRFNGYPFLEIHPKLTTLEDRMDMRLTYTIEYDIKKNIPNDNNICLKCTWLSMCDKKAYCHHPSNKEMVGFIFTYQNYKSSPNEINSNGNCENYNEKSLTSTKLNDIMTV